MLHFLVKRYRQPHSWITVDTISLSAMRTDLEQLWDHYITAMWLSENNGHPPAIRLFSVATVWNQIILRHLQQRSIHCLSLGGPALLWIEPDDFYTFSDLAKLEWQWGGRRQTLNWSASMLLTVSSQLYSTGSHTEAPLLTSDTLHLNCFVFPSSHSTLYNINTADMACKLVWPYLFKVDSWFYPCLTPSRLTCSESLQPPWLQSTETF